MQKRPSTKYLEAVHFKKRAYLFWCTDWCGMWRLDFVNTNASKANIPNYVYFIALQMIILLVRVFSAPSSPVHNRRLLSARPTRMSSVELPDDNEKSVSSASTSPCPSPVSSYTRGQSRHVLNFLPKTFAEWDGIVQIWCKIGLYSYKCPFFQKTHRLLTSNLYVVLYNFKPRMEDELDLK